MLLREKAFDDNFIERVFDMLYGSTDTDAAIRSVLEFMGKRFGVSRAYIAEISEDGKYYQYSFEWNSDGVSPQNYLTKDVLIKEIEYEGFAYQDYFNDENLFVCGDVNELNPTVREILSVKDIKAALQCALLGENGFAGYIGYDDCESAREWRSDEIRALMYAARVLSAFYISGRDKKRTETRNETLMSLIDSIPFMAYIINPANNEMMLINKRTREVFPDINTGDKCYKAIANRDCVCENCPLDEWKKSGKTVRTELYNAYKDIWNDCTVKSFKWSTGEEFCLISCSDITKYKKREALDI